MQRARQATLSPCTIVRPVTVDCDSRHTLRFDWEGYCQQLEVPGYEIGSRSYAERENFVAGHVIE
jgi:hypothetical protein